ncbi:MAG: class I SAM-dependent methyltransferase [Pseudolabrys sp.]
MQAQAAGQQDKQREIAFFDGYESANGYDVFTPETNARIIDAVVRLGRFRPGARVVDLGCGSGVFTDVLHKRGFDSTGVDLSPRLVSVARRSHPDIEFIEGDVERLPFPDASFDGVLLSGLVHHLPDRSRCAAEVFRILKPGGHFVAFDPNRRNPFMYLYRDRTSPFYSSVGVTPNERPVLAEELAAAFRKAGFATGTDYLADLRYRYVASGRVRWLLPLYNAIDRLLFTPSFMARWRPFVLTYGEKR